MCISVRVDVRLPLKKERRVRMAGNEWSTKKKFKHEKLGAFCFVCGCLVHTEQRCEVLFAKEQDDR